MRVDYIGEVSKEREHVAELSDDDLFELHQIISSMRIVQEHNVKQLGRVYAIYGDDVFIVNLETDSLRTIGEHLAKREVLSKSQYEYLKVCLSLKQRYIPPVQMVISYLGGLLMA
ncbi:hypothetical protein [Butyrivibrio hungatei]|uniref:Uncharacterized protein n=1 Tax=Butyrivibrio hungatei TaxID=185008 RepID=A0A1D9P6E4_9FIRM|nr:hypothetical protein [Butyrivibrio hungatei]AOZ97884.1 hypothetical protein bhn_II085 [Butyrivibrio hungatei]